MDRDHRHLHADLPAAAEDLQRRPAVLRPLVALNIQTSFLSPPVAMAPFYLKGVAPLGQHQRHLPRRDAVLLIVITMALLYSFPQIGLWLPNYLYGRGEQAGSSAERVAHGSLCARPAEAAAGIRDGRLSRRSYVGACLDRIEEVERDIQAFAPLDREHAMSQAEAARRARNQGRPRARCMAFRSRSRISSIPAISRPNSARRSSPAAGPITTRMWSAAARGGRRYHRQDRHHRIRLFSSGQDPQSA